MKQSDTSPEMQKYYGELWQKLSFEERFLKGLQWIQFNREFLLAGIRSRFPPLYGNRNKTRTETGAL